MKLRHYFPPLLACLALAVATFAADPPKITGKTKYEPHELIRLKAENVGEKAAMIWRISPSKGVWKATTPKGVLEFSSVPGTFEVTLLVISQSPDGGLAVDEATATVEVEGCGGKLPPAPHKPDPKPEPKSDPVAAIARVQFGNKGCTAAAVWPRRPDGRWDVLCAAHCVDEVGDRGAMTLKDGRRIGIRVASLDKTGDCAWFVTEESVEEMPFVKLAAKNPAVGAKVWHAGYGIDKPTNREEGEVQESENQSGQSKFLLNVSSGDSGGPIMLIETNEVVGAACCTLERGVKTSMWATSAANSARHRPKFTAEEVGAWVPTLLPVTEEGKEKNRKRVAEEWKPAELPIRQEPTAAPPPTAGIGPVVHPAPIRR